MSESNTGWGYIDGILVAEGVDPDARWIDAHSVTCGLCGGYADERETIDLEKRDEYPEGEAHSNCFEYAEEHGVRKAKDDLAPIVTP